MTAATKGFREWSLQLLDRFLSLQQHKEKPTAKGKGKGSRQGQDFTSLLLRVRLPLPPSLVPDSLILSSFLPLLLLLLLQSTLEGLYWQLSPELAALHLRKLCVTVQYSLYPNAVHHIGILCNALAMAHPSLTLGSFLFPSSSLPLPLTACTAEALMPILCESLLKSGVEQHTQTELEWALLLLSSTVAHTGAALLPHLNSIHCLIEAVSALPSPKKSKLAAHLLQTVLLSSFPSSLPFPLPLPLSLTHPHMFRCWRV